jgi:hypothetical protein
VSFVVFRSRFVCANLRVFFALPIFVGRGDEFGRTLSSSQQALAVEELQFEGFSEFPDLSI